MILAMCLVNDCSLFCYRRRHAARIGRRRRRVANCNIIEETRGEKVSRNVQEESHLSSARLQPTSCFNLDIRRSQTEIVARQTHQGFPLCSGVEPQALNLRL